MRIDAFISYSHVNDRPLAAALQAVVQKLGKPWYRRRSLHVFRDDASLAATPELWPSIERALGEARYLILLASPDAAASPWVAKELDYWLAQKKAHTLLIGVTDGDLRWDQTVGDFCWAESPPLPPILKGRFANEPRWVDLRAFRKTVNQRDSAFVEAAANFAAAIQGIAKQDLLSQEVHQQRRALHLAWSAAGTLAILIALTGWQWWEADSAKRAAQKAEQLAEIQRDRAERNFSIAKEAADRVVFQIAQGLRDVQGMRVESIRKILDTARTIIDELVQAAPDDLELQRSRYVMLTEFAETYASAGDLTRAKETAQESLEIARKLVAADPDNLGRQHDLSISLQKLGDAYFAAGDFSEGLALYEQSLAIRRKLVSSDPGDSRWQRDLGVSLAKVGDIQLATGDFAGAVASFDEAVSLIRKLVASDPSVVSWQRDLSVSLVKLGDASLARRDPKTAVAAYEESLAIARRLAADDPGNLGWQHALSVSLNKIGDLRIRAKDYAGALVVYEESLAIRRRLVASDPTNTGWLRGLSVSLEKIGSARLAAGDQASALAAYQECLSITRRLVAAEPDNAEWQADLVVSLVKIATLSHDAPNIRSLLREALDILERLERENRLTVAQRSWPQIIRAQLAKLPPTTMELR